MVDTRRILRHVAAVVAMSALNLGCWSWGHDDRAALPVGSTPVDLEALIAGLAAVFLQLALAWLLLLTVLVALEPVSGRDLTSYAGCPDGLRRMLLACCGAAAAGVLAVPAHAGPISPSPLSTRVTARSVPAPVDPVPGDPAPSAVLEGLPLPDRTIGVLGQQVIPGRSVLVRPGDTLWGIAAAHLPVGSSTVDVDRTWRALYAGNRSRIGSDPDLIMPGTRLRLPPTPHQEDDR